MRWFLEKRLLNELTDHSVKYFFFFAALDESVKIVESLGGWCRGQVVDISRREEVYKAAAEIKNNFGDVSLNLHGRLQPQTHYFCPKKQLKPKKYSKKSLTIAQLKLRSKKFYGFSRKETEANAELYLKQSFFRNHRAPVTLPRVISEEKKKNTTKIWWKETRICCRQKYSPVK